MLKDKFDIVENFGEVDTPSPSVSARNIPQNIPKNIPLNNQDLSNQNSHGLTPFGNGGFFESPYISSDASKWSAQPDSYKTYQQTVNVATPTTENLISIGSQTQSLPGPNNFMDNSYSYVNANQGKENNLSLCAQNMPTGGTAALNVASSLLPMPGQKMEGFESCDATNSLANQVFLTPGGQIGTNTIAGSLRNANQSIRSEPPNTILNVGPWNLSSIYPDLTRRPLEGVGPSFGLYGNGPDSSVIPTKIYS